MLQVPAIFYAEMLKLDSPTGTIGMPATRKAYLPARVTPSDPSSFPVDPEISVRMCHSLLDRRAGAWSLASSHCLCLLSCSLLVPPSYPLQFDEAAYSFNVTITAQDVQYLASRNIGMDSLQ